MRQVLLLLLLLPMITTAAAAQVDWRKELSRELVKVQGSKMVLDDYSLVNLEVEGYEPANIQVHVHGEAPQNGTISRDQFVSIVSSLSSLILINSLAKAYQVPSATFMEGFSARTLPSPIGTPDLRLNFFMTGDGLQIEIIDTATNARTRTVQTWAEVVGG